MASPRVPTRKAVNTVPHTTPFQKDCWWERDRYPRGHITLSILEVDEGGRSSDLQPRAVPQPIVPSRSSITNSRGHFLRHPPQMPPLKPQIAQWDGDPGVQTLSLTEHGQPGVGK